MNRIQAFLRNKSKVNLQFLKYSLAGGLAMATHLICFTFFNETVFPAGVDQASATRGWNFFFSNTVAFFAANIVAYVANRAWVFQPGRHDRLKEIFLFFLIAGVAYAVGTPLGSLLVAHLSVNEYFVYAIVVGLSIMVNFLGRKYLVFLH